MVESRETRIKRLKMRSMRRGIREMDLVLSAFADTHLTGMTQTELDAYDLLLSENDHDLYQWVTGQAVPPAAFGELVLRIRAMAEGLTRQG